MPIFVYLVVGHLMTHTTYQVQLTFFSADNGSGNNANEKETPEVCGDLNKNCPVWISKRFGVCDNNAFVQNNCKQSCDFCPETLINVIINFASKKHGFL